MAEESQQQLLTSETHLLEMLGQGAPMLEILNELCNFIDTQSPGAISTFFLVDSDGRQLRSIAGTKAPKSWNEAIDHPGARPCARFCGSDGLQKELVIAGDIDSDPLFEVHREAARREGLQVVRSIPIFSRERQILGVLALFCPQTQRPSEQNVQIMERAIHIASIAIECHRNEEELRELSRRLSQSQDDERRRIARELHDSTGQKLSVLAMNVAMAEREAEAQGQTPNELLTQCSTLIRNISEEIRTLSYLLHPPMLDECGLDSAIAWYVQGINRRNALHVEMQMPRRLHRLSEEAELAVFRIVQASLTNIHLHSGSGKATVRIKQDGKGCTVIVSDSGRGIPDGVLDRSSRTKGLGVGILGMRERVRQLGGRLEIETSENGTRVKAMIPGHHFRTVRAASASPAFHG
jgi:signal transduction histidine kinase